MKSRTAVVFARENVPYLMDQIALFAKRGDAVYARVSEESHPLCGVIVELHNRDGQRGFLPMYEFVSLFSKDRWA